MKYFQVPKCCLMFLPSRPFVGLAFGPAAICFIRYDFFSILLMLIISAASRALESLIIVAIFTSFTSFKSLAFPTSSMFSGLEFGWICWVFTISAWLGFAWLSEGLETSSDSGILAGSNLVREDSFKLGSFNSTSDFMNVFASTFFSAESLRTSEALNI